MEDLKERVIQFMTLSLPGQQQSMHVGTSHLVNDLLREVQRLESILDRQNPQLPAVLDNIKEERSRQEAKWGKQNHQPLTWLAILGEEVGEANKAVLENELSDYRSELVQVAAVAAAAIECLDRQRRDQ